MTSSTVVFLTQHDDKADAHHDGEGEEVGVDIKGGILCQPHHILIILTRNYINYY